MNFVFRAISLLAALVWFNSVWIGFSNKPAMFLNLPAFLLSIVVPFFIMVGMYGLEALTFYWKRGDIKNQMIDQWSRMVIAGGITGSLLGIVDMLANMRDPKAIGPALAVALLPILYAFTSKLFLLDPFRDLVSTDQSIKDYNSRSVSKEHIKLTGNQKGKLVVTTLIATIVTLFVLIVGVIAAEEYIFLPQKRAVWKHEEKNRSKKWEANVAKINQQNGTSLSSIELKHLFYFVECDDFCPFDSINKVYTDPSIDHKALFASLRQLQEESE